MCTELDKALGDTADITLIEEKEAFYNSIASIRSVVEPGYSDKLWVPYTNLFLKNKRSKVVQAKGVEVDAERKSVKLSNGEEVEYDYLVVATGTRLPPPGKTDKLTKAEAKADAEAIVNAVKAASAVAIIGGGVVGIELAGEIATDYPNVQVTLIHSGPELLHNTKVASPKLRKTLLDTLKSFKNVQVILGERVAGGPDILPGGVGFHLGKHTIKTEKGTEVVSDVQLMATGRQIPNSDLVKGLGAVDEKGFIKVKPTGQLLEHPNIFSLGDVATLDDHKVAFIIGMSQAPLVSKNIISLIKTPTATLKDYTPISSWSTAAPLVISVGRNAGATQLPMFGVFGSFLTRNIKSGDLFVAKPWAMLNASDKFMK
ncbi:hypothetical protein HDU67_002293 [Dinochytrium kinnereticum]|nr:hypothetical protein HDU67_002293 [Dinochytrium kinnereticum]